MLMSFRYFFFFSILKKIWGDAFDVIEIINSIVKVINFDFYKLITLKKYVKFKLIALILLITSFNILFFIIIFRSK